MTVLLLLQHPWVPGGALRSAWVPVFAPLALLAALDAWRSAVDPDHGDLLGWARALSGLFAAGAFYVAGAPIPAGVAAWLGLGGFAALRAGSARGVRRVIEALVILGGLSISLSGWSLLFPFEYPMFAKTFEIINVFGFDLPTQLTAMEEMQLAQLWHAIVAVFLVIVILGHIYIGTIGMEGAFDAMGSGQVDLNWAKEHHGLWVEEKKERDDFNPKPEPAE